MSTHAPLTRPNEDDVPFRLRLVCESPGSYALRNGRELVALLDLDDCESRALSMALELVSGLTFREVADAVAPIVEAHDAADSLAATARATVNEWRYALADEVAHG